MRLKDQKLGSFLNVHSLDSHATNSDFVALTSTLNEGMQLPNAYYGNWTYHRVVLLYLKALGHVCVMAMVIVTLFIPGIFFRYIYI